MKNSVKKTANIVSKQSKKETNKKVSFKNISPEQLAEMNLDDINIYDLLSENDFLKEKLITKKGSKDGMYKKEAQKSNESDKNFRSRIRKTRNTYIENVLNFLQLDMKTELKKEIESFNKFYKETYLLNDYSVASVARLNSDKITLGKLNLFFQVIKRNKTTTKKAISKKVTLKKPVSKKVETKKESESNTSE